jgi:hypothetical protein
MQELFQMLTLYFGAAGPEMKAPQFLFWLAAQNERRIWLVKYFQNEFGADGQT